MKFVRQNQIFIDCQLQRDENSTWTNNRDLITFLCVKKNRKISAHFCLHHLIDDLQSIKYCCCIMFLLILSNEWTEKNLIIIYFQTEFVKPFILLVNSTFSDLNMNWCFDYVIQFIYVKWEKKHNLGFYIYKFYMHKNKNK